MKILREKIFFDYKKYAEEYGEEAAERMKEYRSKAANAINISRKVAKSDQRRAEQLAKQGRKDSAAVRRELAEWENSMAEKGLQKAREGVAELRGYEQGKKAAQEAASFARKKVAKKVGIAGAVGLGLAGAGLGYAAYKRHKDKKKEEK